MVDIDMRLQVLLLPALEVRLQSWACLRLGADAVPLELASGFSYHLSQPCVSFQEIYDDDPSHFCLGNAAAASVVSQRERNKCEDDEKSSSSTKKGADVRNINVCIYFIYSNSGKILLNVNGWPLTRAWVVCSAIKKWILH